MKSDLNLNQRISRLESILSSKEKKIRKNEANSAYQKLASSLNDNLPAVLQTVGQFKELLNNSEDDHSSDISIMSQFIDLGEKLSSIIKDLS